MNSDLKKDASVEKLPTQATKATAESKRITSSINELEDLLNEDDLQSLAEAPVANAPVPCSKVNAAGMTARWISSISELEAITPQWEELTRNSVSWNPYLDPSLLIPAFSHLNDCDARCLVLEEKSESKETNGPRRLLGLIPLVEKRVYGLPVKSVAFWNHDQCFNSTPLLHRDCPCKVLETMFSFLSDQKYGLLKIETMLSNSTVNQAVKTATTGFGKSLFVTDTFERSAFEPAENFDQYLLDNVSKNTRKKNRRYIRGLEKIGDVTFEQSDQQSDFEALAHQFLALEQSSWKGRNGTALASEESSQRYYLDSVARLAKAGKARFVSLKLDGKVIAMLSDFESDHEVNAFKTAFDEDFASYSPGILIETHNVQLMHDDEIRFADSCTVAGNTTMNRVWGQTIEFQNIVVGLRFGLPTLLTTLMPTMQKLHRARKQRKESDS